MTAGILRQQKLWRLLLWDALAVALSIEAAPRLGPAFAAALPYAGRRPFFVLAATLLFWGFGLLFSTWVGWGTVGAAAQPVAVGAAVVSTAALLLMLGLPLEIAVIWGLLLFSLALAGRLLPTMGASLLRQRRQRQLRGQYRRAVIFGAGELGCYLVEKLRRERPLPGKGQNQGILPVAFVDDRADLGKRRLGLRVVVGSDLLPEILPAYRADLLIVAINRLPPEKLSEILQLCSRAKVQVQRFGLSEQTPSWEGVDKARLADIDLCELLRRDAVTLNMEAVQGLLRGKRVLVTGAAGSIGSELCRQALGFGAEELILFDIHENGLFLLDRELRQSFDPARYHLELGSVQDRSRLDGVMERYRPHLVLHAAAHKHVPMVELSPGEAVKNNVAGTLNTALSAMAHGAERFLLISTDKAVNPTSVMGATKRIAELIVQVLSRQSSGTRLCGVRFGNVLGSSGSVVPIFQKQIARGGPVTVTHPEMRRYFMTIPEAVQLVLEAATMAQGGELFVLDMGEPVRIYDMACDLIRLAGLEPERDIPIVFSGTRPGEKLFEEIALTEEETTKTQNNKIYVNHPTSLAEEAFLRQLEELLTCPESAPPAYLYQCIKALVPTFAHEE